MGPQLKLKKAPALAVPTLGAGERLEPGDRALRFRASKFELVPFNEVTDQRYTVYWRVS
jgi:hypothetical protein